MLAECLNNWATIISHYCLVLKIYFYTDKIYVHKYRCPWGPKEGVRPPGTGVTLVVSHLTWVLGIELGSTVRATPAPPHPTLPHPTAPLPLRPIQRPAG